MLTIRNVFFVLGLLLSSVASAAVQVSIGINVSAYPHLVRVPGYPVYYAPQLQANYFFYDGLYWVYQDDDWYASSWYDGPWGVVDPEDVPVFILRIPVRYYRQPAAYFRGWRRDAPPRWGEHWGRDWEQRRRGWDQWNRRAAPAPAPLPVYQRQYSRDRYPGQVEQQQKLQQQHYRYQPREPIVRQYYQQPAVQKAPTHQEKQVAPEHKGSKQQDIQRSTPHPQDGSGAPRSQSPQRGQQMPASQGQEERQQGKDVTREPKPKREQGQGQDKERGRGRDRDHNE